MQDIGSEFEWHSADESGSGYPISGLFTFSGRTALRTVTEDALSERRIACAWLPSYCCDSMVLPFADLGIPVRFYEVSFGDGVLHRADVPVEEGDLVLTMSYFGFCDEGHLEWTEACRVKGAVIVEDQTHSLLSGHHARAHYRVASLRKWFPIACGGLAEKIGGELVNNLLPPAPDVIATRISAMKEKACYLLSGGSEEAKASFLEKYRLVNEVYDTDYAGRAGDEWSLAWLRRADVCEIRRRRRENALVLLEELRHTSVVTPLYGELRDGDVPLFVPVLTERHRELQRFLAQHHIYCPIHWPCPCGEAQSALYGQELSLICDQRYDREDMQRLVSVLRSFE